MHKKNMTFSAEAEKEIETFAEAVREILRISVKCFMEENREEAVKGRAA